jgi:hypothetical protein
MVQQMKEARCANRGDPGGGSLHLLPSVVVIIVMWVPTRPLFMKTNFSDWSTMMRVMLRARGLCAAIKDEAVDEEEDQMSMGALLRGVPLEMSSYLTSKPSTKVAWDLLQSLPHCIWRQYENNTFLDDKSLEDFALHLVKMVHELEI